MAEDLFVNSFQAGRGPKKGPTKQSPTNAATTAAQQKALGAERDSILTRLETDLRNQVGSLNENPTPSGSMSDLAQAYRTKCYYDAIQEKSPDAVSKGRAEQATKLFDAQLKKAGERYGKAEVTAELIKPEFTDPQEKFVSAALSTRAAIQAERTAAPPKKANDLDVARSVTLPETELSAAKSAAAAADTRMTASATEAKERAVQEEKARRVQGERDAEKTINIKAHDIITVALADKLSEREKALEKAESERKPDKRERKIADAERNYTKSLKSLAARSEAMIDHSLSTFGEAAPGTTTPGGVPLVQAADRQRAEVKLEQLYVAAQAGGSQQSEREFYSARAEHNLRAVLNSNPRAKDATLGEWDKALDPAIEPGGTAAKGIGILKRFPNVNMRNY